MRLALVLAGALALGACTEPLPPQHALVGNWIEEGAGPDTRREMRIGAAEVFVFTVPYADGGVTFIVGTWEVDGNRITFTTMNKTEYPASGGSKRTDPYVDPHFFQSATFGLTPSALTLNYLSFPADAPVATQMVFRRDDG